MSGSTLGCGFSHEGAESEWNTGLRVVCSMRMTFWRSLGQRTSSAGVSFCLSSYLFAVGNETVRRRSVCMLCPLVDCSRSMHCSVLRCVVASSPLVCDSIRSGATVGQIDSQNDLGFHESTSFDED